MDNKQKIDPQYDSLRGWREENGIGTKVHYEGGCEYDPMVEAILAYEREQAMKEKSEQEQTPEM